MKIIVKLSIVFVVCLSNIAPTLADNSRIHTVIDTIMESTVAVYSSIVVKKLERDGTGASSEYTKQKGFVPIADEFVRQVSFDSIMKAKRSGETFSYGYAPGGKGRLAIKLAEGTMTKEQEATVIAKVLDSVIRSIRGSYSQMVLRKLKREGAGASLEYLSKPGFVPLPAVFAREVAAEVVSKLASVSDNKISVALRSRWNLNREQGLKDSFEREGWKFLEQQQSSQLDAGKSLRNFPWKPFVKMETDEGKQILRYLSADIAAGKGCVACHNSWESKEGIKSLRTIDGVEAGKVFKLHELMGSLSILVQM